MLGSAVMISGLLSQHQVECMPPRQTRLLPERAITVQPFRYTPLDEGSAARPSSSSALAPTSTPSSSTLQPWQPPRDDGQSVGRYTRGSKRLAIQIAADSLARNQARSELEDRVYSRSNVGSIAAKRDTWAAVAAAAGYADPFVPNPDLLYDVSASLWKAGYRSLDSYIGVARQEMVLLHGDLPESFALHIKRVSRAAARGRGPSKQACDLPFEKLGSYALRFEPFSSGGPCYPGRVAIIASWWMLREIELSNLTLDCINFENTSAELKLPISKMDPTGRGTSRSLCCTCSSTPSSLCPFHTLKAQFDYASSLSSSPSAPLCPTAAGKAATKKETVLTIMGMAEDMGLALHTRSGAPRFTGHSFRVTGAMWLASSGIDVWRIQLHGRWGSDTVLRYVRLAPLAKSLAIEVSLGKDLSNVRTALLQAKATLADLAPSSAIIPIDDSLAEALGPLAKPATFLGRPSVDHILGNEAVKGWTRKPKKNELLVSNIGPPNYDGKLHSLRPPLCISGPAPAIEDWEPTCTKPWCGGWNFMAAGARASLHIWKGSDSDIIMPLCKRCFGEGTPDDLAAGSSSGSSSSS